MTPRPDPRLFITPATAAAIDALTLGQVMRLLQARGGDMARAWIAELRIAAPNGFRGATLEDTCMLVSRGLLSPIARGDYRLTQIGGQWVDVILENAADGSP
jgi:hypothetical protein